MEVLSNDLVRECLLRVPYNSHDNLKAVCRSWEAMVSSPKFYADRKTSGKTEQLLCLIRREPVKVNWLRYVFPGKGYVFVIMIYDPVKGTCERLPPINDLHFAGIPQYCECVAVRRKLVLMGGLHPSSNRRMKSVYIYDFESERWSRGADMPTPRYSFACSVDSSTGLVYVAGGISDDLHYFAGGINDDLHPLAAAEVYNVEEDKWEILPPMIQPHGWSCHGVFMEGKFMVFEDRSAEVFEPSAGTWRRLEDMSYLWRKCAVSSGELYTFSEKPQRQVVKYDGEKNVWTSVASLPQSVLCVTCATQWGDWIFVSGFDSTKKLSYLFSPSTGQWIEVKGDGGKLCVVSAAVTVEI